MRADEDFPRKTITPCRQTYLNKLTANRSWHRFHAIDQEGSQIPVEFSLLKVDSANERLFLMNLRHAKVA